MKHLVLTITIVLLFSCSKKNKQGQVPASIQAIIDKKSCVCQPIITQYKRNASVFYLYAERASNCNSSLIFFDAQGKEITFTTVEFSVIPAGSEFIREVWKCQ